MQERHDPVPLALQRLDAARRFFFHLMKGKSALFVGENEFFFGFCCAGRSGTKPHASTLSTLSLSLSLSLSSFFLQLLLLKLTET